MLHYVGNPDLRASLLKLDADGLYVSMHPPPRGTKKWVKIGIFKTKIVINYQLKLNERHMTVRKK